METVTIDQPLPRRADNTDPVNMPGKVVRLQAAAHFVDEPNPRLRAAFRQDAQIILFGYPLLPQFVVAKSILGRKIHYREKRYDPVCLGRGRGEPSSAYQSNFCADCEFVTGHAHLPICYRPSPMPSRRSISSSASASIGSMRETWPFSGVAGTVMKVATRR